MSTDTSLLATAIDEFRQIKKLADKTIEQLSDDQLFQTLDADSNSVAILMRHMAGNMRSRWVDFLVADGEKPDRMRDREFENLRHRARNCSRNGNTDGSASSTRSRR